MVFDKNRKEVKIGSWVRVIYIDPGFISTFPSNKSKEIRSMLNQVLEVTEFAHGKALVSQQDQSNNDRGFSLALSSEEMELVDYP